MTSGHIGGVLAGREFRGRDGFTLVELLVVISVLAVLTALILPAVMRSREAARATQCRNHLRNIGVAMLAAADTHRRFPASGHWGLDAAGQPAPFHNWVVELLPWLDRRDLSERWDRDRQGDDPANQQWARLHLAVLACPSDITVVRQGDLSYVVNGGFGWTTVHSGVADCPVSPSGVPLDLNGDGIACPPPPGPEPRPTDRELYFQTGLFFLETWKDSTTVRHHSPGTVEDGLSHTLLLAENVRAGFDPYARHANWASSEPRRMSFFVGEVCRDWHCAPGEVDYRRANAGASAINAALTQPEGEAPWPSSFHAGGVHVAFADGRIHFLSEAVDGAVLAALASPQGARITGHLQQPLLTDTAY